MARRVAAPFKACRKCKRLVPSSSEKCPYCGSSEITSDWSGMIIIIDRSSLVAERLELEEEGKYAIRVR